MDPRSLSKRLGAAASGRLCACAALLFVALTTSCRSTGRTGPEFVAGWELIAPDYANVRGVDYVPDYPSLRQRPPALRPGETYQGVASSVAIWRFFQVDDVRTQLAYLRGIGCNAVRVWLSSAAYAVEGPAFVAKVEQFFRLAEAARVYVMPVLFDYDFLEPNPADPYGDIDRWVRSPSLAELDAGSDFRSRPRGGDEYVTRVVEAVRSSPALLMWDIMNEPPPTDFLGHYLELVKRLDPDHPTTIGWGGLSDSLEPGQDSAFVDHPALDVLSIHPYGIFYQTYAEAVRRMRYVNALRNPVPKPMLVTEIGHPGGFQRYEHALDYIARDGVQNGRPLGFFVWQAMIGDEQSRHPFHKETGLLFADGTARDPQAVEAFRAVAVRQGIAGLPAVRAKPRTDPDFFDYDLPPLDVAQIVDFLRNWRDRRAPLRDDNYDTDGYRLQSELLRQVSVSLVWTGRIPGGHGTAIAPADVDLVLRRVNEMLPRDLKNADNIEHLVHDGWIAPGGPNGYTVDWSRWEDLFASVAADWIGVIDRNGLGS